MRSDLRMKLAMACLLGIATSVAVAKEKPQQPGIDPDVLTEGFLAAHPDLRWRAEGVRDYAAGRYDAALTELLRAARYADKPSQAMIAGMYWDGVGVPKDRPLAYAWMDIAAERMYHDFVVYREIYWNALTADERRDAIARGQAILAGYGDDVAKRRLEQVLKRASRQATGSRVGFVGNLTIVPFTGPLAGMGVAIHGDQYYAEKYWKPEQYWHLQDAIWKAPQRVPRIEVGPLQQVTPARDARQTPP